MSRAVIESMMSRSARVSADVAVLSRVARGSLTPT
jgi:hypothetical protein